jgi:hypothetical protein
MTLAAKVVVARAFLITRRSGLRRRRQLVRELADYSTPSQRLEIETILDQYDDDQTHELRSILAGCARLADVSPRARGPLG